MSLPPPWLPRWVSWGKVEAWGACEHCRGGGGCLVLFLGIGTAAVPFSLS